MMLHVNFVLVSTGDILSIRQKTHSPCWTQPPRSTWAVPHSLCLRASVPEPWHRTQGHQVSEPCGTRRMWLQRFYEDLHCVRLRSEKTNTKLTFPPPSAVSPGLCEASGHLNCKQEGSVVSTPDRYLSTREDMSTNVLKFWDMNTAWVKDSYYMYFNVLLH